MEANQINKALHTLARHVPKVPDELVEKMVRSVNALNRQRSLRENTTPDQTLNETASPSAPVKPAAQKPHKKTL